MVRIPPLGLSAVLLTLMTLLGWSRLSAAEAAAPVDDLIACPACEGAGTVPCKAHCKDGKVRCPSTCLKKDDPGWVPGPGGKTVKYFPEKPRKPGTVSDAWWSTGHIGQLIVYENGKPVNKGVCPTCKGTGLVDCKVCKGAGKQACSVCKGAKRVSQADAEAYQKRKQEEVAANTIKLTDGRELHGKVLSRSSEQVVIKTEDGKMVSLKPEEIASEAKPEAGAAPGVEPLPAP